MDPSYSSIPQAPEKLLRATFSQPENAAGFFRHYLPASVAETFSWESIRPASFVDPKFAHSESDLLFQVRSGETDAYLYLRFEHQSAEADLLAFRLLSYITRFWGSFMDADPASPGLPPIMTVVLAQGRASGNTTESLAPLIAIPPGLEADLQPSQPQLIYKLIELARLPYDQIKGTPDGVLTLRALKADPVDELLSDSVWDVPLLESVSPAALERFLRYVCCRHPSREALLQKIRQFPSKKIEPALMTIAEQFRTEGIKLDRTQDLNQGLLQ